MLNKPPPKTTRNLCGLLTAWCTVLDTRNTNDYEIFIERHIAISFNDVLSLSDAIAFYRIVCTYRALSTESRTRRQR